MASRAVALQEVDDGIPAIVITGMAPRCCDASVENQMSVAIVQEDLSGGSSAEAFRHCRVSIGDYVYVWNPRCRLPQVRVGPILLCIGRFVEEDGCSHLTSAAGGNVRQLFERRA